MIAFDPTLHRYTFQGVRIPSVTDILAAMFPDQWQAVERYGNSEYVKSRGSAVHACAAFIMRGEGFSFPPMDPETQADIDARLDAVRLFKRDMRPEVVLCETPLYHPLHRYAGTPDLVARIDGELVLVDWKGSINAVCALQLAAYSLLLETAGIKVRRAYAVELRNNGKYQVGKEVNLKIETRHWLNERSCYGWRVKNGIIKEAA